jgi:hypothetical protein
MQSKIIFIMKASSRNVKVMGRGGGGCYYFLFEKNIVKCFVQLALSLAGQHPIDKHPVNTSHCPQIVQKCFTRSIIWLQQ